MSGCWIVKYRRKGDICLGHIGTEESPSHHNSIKVKKAWLDAQNNAEFNMEIIACFKPAWEGPLLKPITGDGSSFEIALVTENNECYSVLCYERGQEILRVAGVQRAVNKSPIEMRNQFQVDIARVANKAAAEAAAAKANANAAAGKAAAAGN